MVLTYQPDVAAAPSHSFLTAAVGDGGKKIITAKSANVARKGIVFITANYRLYPEVRFPAFPEDAALASAWVRKTLGCMAGTETIFPRATRGPSQRGLAGLIRLTESLRRELMICVPDVRSL